MLLRGKGKFKSQKTERGNIVQLHCGGLLLEFQSGQ